MFDFPSPSFVLDGIPPRFLRPFPSRLCFYLFRGSSALLSHHRTSRLSLFLFLLVIALALGFLFPFPGFLQGRLCLLLMLDFVFHFLSEIVYQTKMMEVWVSLFLLIKQVLPQALTLLDRGFKTYHKLFCFFKLFFDEGAHDLIEHVFFLK